MSTAKAKPRTNSPENRPETDQVFRFARFFRFGRAWIWFLAAAIPLTLGCVQRRMLIRTDPPGALVYVDDYEIGTTPIATNFTYYGTRKIRIVKDGFETLTVEQPIDSPWYQIPPLDFFSDNLTPGEIRDQRILNYRLTPQRQIPTQELVARADQLRGQVRATQFPTILPSAPSIPATAPISTPAMTAPMQPGMLEPIPAPNGNQTIPYQPQPATAPAQPGQFPTVPAPGSYHPTPGAPINQTTPTTVPTYPTYPPNAPALGNPTPTSPYTPSYNIPPSQPVPASEPIPTPMGQSAPGTAPTTPTFTYPGPQLRSGAGLP